MDSELRAAAEVVNGVCMACGSGVLNGEHLRHDLPPCSITVTPEQIEAAAKAGYAFSVAQGDYYEQDVPPFEEATPDRQRRMKATAGAVIAAYLATLPADDAEPITRQWMASIGFKYRSGWMGLWLGEFRWNESGPKTVFTLGEKIIKDATNATRGDVRRLLAALGIA